MTTSTNSTTGEITYTLTKYNYTQKVTNYDTSEIGMYAIADADNNTTYYYRGSVSDNFVKFAGYYWRIIRVNGDGSIRLIYDGTKGHENGENSSNRQIGASAFNTYYNDNAYVGYMYGDVNNFEETNSGTHVFDRSAESSTARYYFADSYTLDTSTRTYKLAGNIFNGILDANKTGYYTCFSTSETGACQTLFYITKYSSALDFKVKGYGYGATSLEGAHSNETSSTMKTYLESWYSSKLSDYDSVISKDAIFCNNRTKSSYNSETYTNEGYGINPTIYGYSRFWRWGTDTLGATLTCEVSDSFTSSSTIGNGNLTYPIGLITADEVNLAGGTVDSSNLMYYLYTGNKYWTMSPSSYISWVTAYMFQVNSTGRLNRTDGYVNYGVRPVININPDKITFTGVGTIDDPYVVS